MLGLAGYLCTWLALVSLTYACVSLLWGMRRSGSLRHSYGAMHAATAFLAIATALLLYALLTDRFELAHVAGHSSRALPAYFKIAGLWAGQEGSLLFWAAMQTGLGSLMAARSVRRNSPWLPWASAILAGIAALFVALTVFVASPFYTLEHVPPDGQGLSAILRHPLMTLHPPALYLGFVGLSAPFALALGGLLSGSTEAFPHIVRRWALGAWLFLGLGLLLGARWAYDVLGWGGYWSWDAVENAALMPWLVATALLHGLALQGKSSRFLRTNVLLALIAFCLVLFGILVARGGILDSLHAYGGATFGGYMLLVLGLTIAVSCTVICKHRTHLAAPCAAPALAWRGRLLVATIVALFVLAGSVLVGTILPTLLRAMGRPPSELGDAWFDRVTGPQFLLLLALLALYVAVIPRQQAWWYVLHVGVLLMAVGIVGSRCCAQQHATSLQPGQSAEIRQYVLVYEGLERGSGAEPLTVRATLAVYRQGRFVTRLHPRMDFYAQNKVWSAYPLPAAHRSLQGDLYVVMTGWTDDGAKGHFEISVNPLVNWLWLGGVLLILGGTWALARPKTLV